MKIISFNIGIKIDNASKVKEYLKTQNVDIVCLQEVVRPLEPEVFQMYRSEEEIRNFLKESYPYYFFAPEWIANRLTKSTGGGNREFGGMIEQGKLILSKYPIIHGYNYFYYKTYEFDCDRTKFHEGDDHGRALQVVKVDINGTVIQIGNVHGSYSSDKLDTDRSLIQSGFILEKLQEQRHPTILLGDFNVLPDTKSVTIINKEYTNLNDKFNVSSTRPNGQIIDYIFTSKDMSTQKLVVDEVNISDHHPLIMEFQ